MISGTFKVKAGMAQMAKGGIVMDVVNAEEARIAEEAGVSLPNRINQPLQKDWNSLLFLSNFSINLLN